MVVKVCQKKEDIAGWKEVTIMVNDKILTMSVSKRGYVLIHANLSDMEIRILADGIMKVTETYEEGGIYKLNSS